MIGVCWKPLVLDDLDRTVTVSEADRAALELGLRLRESFGTVEVVVAAVGPPRSDDVLRTALATGADRVLRIDAPDQLRSDVVAHELANALRGADWILCGDYSADRGSGSVPAYLAAERGASQALGLIEVTAPPADAGVGQGALQVVRRLDGGRRELLEVTAPAIISVEGSVARLRRASLPAIRAATDRLVEVLPGPGGPVDRPSHVMTYRPRARVLPPPTATSPLERIRALTESGDTSRRGDPIVADPATAAQQILAALTDWGYPSDPEAKARHNER